MRMSMRSAIFALPGAAVLGAAALVTIPAVASHAAASGPAAASETGFYLQVTGVTGEATVAKQPGWIALTGYSDSYASVAPATGVGAARPTFGGLTVTAQYSSAVPQLLTKLATNAVLSTVKIEGLKVVGTTIGNYLTITLTNARLASVSESGAATVPSVVLQFVANKVCESYSPTSPFGTLEAPVSSCGTFTTTTANRNSASRE